MEDNRPRSGQFWMDALYVMSSIHLVRQSCASEKINFSYYILLHLITSHSSYFEGKKGISGNKTSFFLLTTGPWACDGWYCFIKQYGGWFIVMHPDQGQFRLMQVEHWFLQFNVILE